MLSRSAAEREHVDDVHAHVAVRREHATPPIVLVTNGPRGGQVAACCSAAREQGVRAEMPLAEAQALVPHLQSFPHEPPADRRALEKLAEACERFTPCVGLEEGDAPESLLLDISNLEHLWGNETQLAERSEKFFTRRGYRVRIAVADTVGLAWAFAHYGEYCKLHDYPTGGARNCKSQIAEPRPNSNNLHFAFCNLHFAIPPLPVEALRIEKNIGSLLHELGIETIHQLLLLPREDLAQRFGDELLLRLDQLTGAANEVIEPHRASAPWQSSHSLDEPTADRAFLMHVLSELVNRLTRQLAARDRGAVQLLCILHGTDGRTTPLTIGLLQSSANPKQLMELIELHLEQVTLADEVDRVELRATIVSRLGERQAELFEDRWPTSSHQLALLANRLSSRLGSERVLRVELRPSPVPERAMRWTAVTKGKDKGTRRQGDKEKRRRSNSPCLPLSLSPCPAPRPILLHPQPHALEVVSIAPDGPPQFVWLDHRRQRVVHHVGPERIETLWWRGRSIRRDYYRIATEEGSHLWIYRELANAKWFLHGEFE
jgi:protein ImuB